MNTLGQRIVFAREKCNLRQNELAKKLGITPTRLNYYEKDKREPDVMMLQKIAKALNVDPNYLLGGRQMNSIDENKLLLSDQTFISRIAEAFNLDDNLFSAMLSEMSSEDIRIFLTPSVYVPANPRYRLKRARFSAGLRQTELAKKLGISLNEYSEYESGKKPLTNKMIIDISKLLDVNPDWLFCSIKYVDPNTGNTFDPGEYKSLVDSAYDPIDLKLELFEFHFPMKNHDPSAICSMLSMYLKLDLFDQGVICGEIRTFLRSEKYSLKQELWHA